MTDKSKKLLAKLSAEQRFKLTEALHKLQTGHVENLDVKPLKGYKDVFRLRIGQYRVIFHKKNNEFRQIAILKRDDQTYRDF